VPKPEEELNAMEEQSKDVTKMAIGVPGGFGVAQKKYEYKYSYNIVAMPGFQSCDIGETECFVVFKLTINSLFNLWYRTVSKDLRMVAKHHPLLQSALKFL